MSAEDPYVLKAVDFEVYGQVQEIRTGQENTDIETTKHRIRFRIGCYFTKFCKEIAEELGIGGWVKNSKKGTIVGKLQGPKQSLDQMIDWLSTTGSPGCKIEKCDLTNWQYLARLDYHNFSIRF